MLDPDLGSDPPDDLHRPSGLRRLVAPADWLALLVECDVDVHQPSSSAGRLYNFAPSDHSVDLARYVIAWLVSDDATTAITGRDRDAMK